MRIKRLFLGIRKKENFENENLFIFQSLTNFIDQFIDSILQVLFSYFNNNK